MAGSHFRTRIKFCGLTRPGDARLACELGVDAVGVIFAAKSQRRVAPARAAAVRAAIDEARPTLLQFHGSEDDAFCRRFGLPYIKGLGLGGARVDAGTLRARWPHAAGFVLDGHAPGAAGGSGQRLEAGNIPADLDRPWLLAGGLDPDNVGDAVRAVRPWGVDVAGGIELAPGVKDGLRMRRFVEAVRAADADATAAMIR